MQVSISDAKNRLSQLIKSVQAGEEVIIANRGKPIVRLVPAHTTRNVSGIGSGKSILGRFERHPLPGYARRSAKEIDVSLEEESHSWD